MYYRLAAQTEETQKFWAHDETSTGGVLGVYVNGTLTTGDTLSASNDYCGVVEAAIRKGYNTYQIALDGVAIGESVGFYSAPEAGEVFDLLFTGDGRLLDTALPLIKNRENVRGHWGIEWHYIEGYYTVSGPDYLSQYRTGYADIWATELERQEFLKSIPTRFMWDNHEIGPGGASWPTPGTDAFDQPEQAASEWLFAGNPDNTDSPIDTNAKYFAEAVGDVQIIQLDPSSYSSTSGEAVLVDAGRGGDYQASWCADVINNTTANIIILLCGKEFSYGDTTSWDTISAAINACGKPVVFLEFDTHAPYARLTDRGVLSSQIVSIGGGAINQTTTKTLNQSHINDEWKFCSDGSTGTYDIFNNDDIYFDKDNVNTTYVLVSRKKGKTEFRIKSVLTGKTRYKITVNDDLTITEETLAPTW